jgi:hypothetical protein
MAQKRNNDYRGGAALLKKQQEANTKKYKAMTPAQKKAYNVKQAKAIGKTAAQVASMVGGVGLARKAGTKVVGKALARNLRNSSKNSQRALKAANTPKVDIKYKKFANVNLKGNVKREIASGVSTARKATGPKNMKDLTKLGKALNRKTKGVKGQPLVDLSNNASKRRGGNFGGGAPTRAGAPSRLIDRNIARHSALRKKFPKNVKP